MKLVKKTSLTLFFGAFALITGCATVPSNPAEFQGMAEVRAKEYWQHVVAGRYDQAYAYLSAATRTVLPSDRYAQQMRGMRTKSAKVDKATCNAEGTCQLTLSVDVDIRIPRVGFSQVPVDHREVWAFSNGNMYLIRQ
jgi:hypothetical protein